jgi:hypothetical protein
MGKLGIPGLSFSWKRALGLSAAKGCLCTNYGSAFRRGRSPIGNPLPGSPVRKIVPGVSGPESLPGSFIAEFSPWPLQRTRPVC